MRSCNPDSLLPYLGICFLVSRRSQIPLICFMWFSILPLIIPCHLSQEFSIFVFSHVQLSWPHGLQHCRLPCPPPSLRACPNQCPLSVWCHPTHLILCHPLLLLPSIFPSIRVFSNESALCNSSVQFSHSVVSDFLQLHDCCTPGFLSVINSWSLLKFMSIESWCHPTISSSSSPSPLAFNLSQHQGLFQWVNTLAKSIGVSASASVLPMSIQHWFPLGWTSWISLQSKGLSRLFSNTTVQKHQLFGIQLSL